MSNPFRKRPTLDASERIKQRKAETMMKTLQTKPSNQTTKNYTLKNDSLVSTINHTQKLEYTRGFYQLNCDCDNVQEHVNQVAEGIYSYIDWSTIPSENTDPCLTKPVYELDECRIEKGLIVPVAKIDPAHKERIFKYPIPIQKVNECCLPTVNNLTSPKHHDISATEFHQHYFPTNDKIVNYGHSHDTMPHGSSTYDHLNKDATNMYSHFETLNQVTEGCCDD